jgi:hypothetical protein
MSETRDAACHCGQLRLTASGEPLDVFLCHCLACQRRTGSAFGVQAAFNAGQVEVTGRFHDHSRISDEADRREHVFHFCPDCGSQVFQSEPAEPELVVVAVGAFADPSFPQPTRASYDGRRHPWVTLPDSVRRDAPELWDSVRPLYETGRYAEAADKGRELIAAHPEQGNLYYNVACCESLAGRTDDAIEHLRQVIAMWDGCRDMARDDADFDPIRDEPAFAQLLED